MQYKTIFLGLLKDCPEMHEQLRKKKQLLPAVNRYARQLRKRHLAWIDLLAEEQPESTAIELANQALEFAVKEFEKAFPSGQPPEESDSPSLGAAIAFVTRHTPPA